jgi:hypothetical protein
MFHVRSHLDRSHLARALDDMARADMRLARALTTCEAWEGGYISALLAEAAQLAANDDPSNHQFASDRDRAVDAVQRAVLLANPRALVAHADMHPMPEAIDALFSLLDALAEFHRITAELERRQALRVPPPI